MIKIVILDGYTTNPGDLNWDELARFGELTVYDRTPAPLLLERAAGAEILLTNKVVLDGKSLSQLNDLRFISVLATGFNVVDTVAAKESGILVSNVRGYAAQSAAQHVFALLLELTNRVNAHHRSVQAGDWGRTDDFSYTLSPTLELAGKTMGIYGFGQIGQRVANIALGFGMRVISHHKHPERDARPGVEFVAFETLLTESDVLSLNAPLTSDNQGIINSMSISKMKNSAYLINTGRGGLVVESDLKIALESGQLAGAGLDVISEEPPKNGNLLFGVKNCIITPHMAWATQEARALLITETVKNVKAYLEGKPRNLVG